MTEPAVAPPADHTAKARLLARAVDTWTGELVDLGGRNTLLYYRDLKQGTLDLSPGSASRDGAVEALLVGHKVRLSELFDDTTRPSAARRARTVKAKADENFEERGLQTLFVAWGMATWDNPTTTATPAAPVLLRQAALASRGGAGEDFDLTLPGEWEINPTLLHLLKTDYLVELVPADLLSVFDEDAEPPDPTAVFDRLTKAAELLPGFVVHPRVVAGNFSYAKLPMVLDLENAADTLMASDLICAVVGDETARNAVRARHPNITLSEPDRVPPADEFLVLDADASQSYAINAAVGGADLVIDGPPGTGKSQTIANLIATLSARGQQILFVAEKRAAIDAVLDRLNRVGLGELVLDLHEGAGSKRKLAMDLSRTMASAASLPRPEMTDAQEALVRRRTTLVERTDALHTPRAPWDISVYDIQVRLLAVPTTATSDQRLRGDILARLDRGAFVQSRADLETFIGLGGLTLDPKTNPWGTAFAAGTITTSEVAQAALDAASTLATHTLPEAAERLGRAATECGLGAPDTIGGWKQVLGLLDGLAAILARFEPAIFAQPLAELAAALAPADKGGFGRVGSTIGNSAYRKAHKKSLSLWRGHKPKPHDLHVATQQAASAADAWRQAVTDGGTPRLPSDLTGAVGAYVQLFVELGALGAWTGRSDLTAWTVAQVDAYLHALLGDTRTASKLPELIDRRTRMQAAGLGPLLIEMGTRNLTLDQALACLDHVWLSSVLDAVTVADARIGAFDGSVQTRTVSEYQAADRNHIGTATLRVRRAVAERATQARDAWPDESDIIERQARLKKGHLPVRDLFQAAEHVLGALKPCWAMSPLVVAQLLPARRLFDVVIFDEASQVMPADAIGALMRADRAILAGDPHQLPPTSFFSASSGGGEDDEDLEEETYQVGTQNMESILDAMSALLPPPKGTRTLGWHYRSRDERLIAFSNAQPNLYDWALTTFPGVGGDDDCITHRLVELRPGRPGQEDSVTDEVTMVAQIVAEHAATRPGESLGVIAMGIKHANRIEEALRRARTSDDALDALLSGTASDQSRKEPFFVKNLERVQGDERDAIILTVGYGKTAEGRMLYRFGPINNDAGERRLNVAITRARSRMTVVSSFSSSDMDPNKLHSEGAQMLSRYLAYAESGGSDLGNVAKDKPELNPFERDIAQKLRAAGIPLVAQYGCSGYWIDYAAQHPTRPGQMVLAIECDGASYHSSATARDRDRLRQDHLERLGWRFHRIWSQEWFYRRETEITKAVAAYHAAVTAIDAGERGYRWSAGRGPANDPSIAGPRPADSESTPAEVNLAAPHLQAARSSDPQPAVNITPHQPERLPEPGSAQATRAGLCPVSVGRTSIDLYTHPELVSVVRWIESDTLLRTHDELLAQVMKVLGFARKGSKITRDLNAAILSARDPNWSAPEPYRRPAPPVTRPERTQCPRSNKRGRY